MSIRDRTTATLNLAKLIDNLAGEPEKTSAIGNTAFWSYCRQYGFLIEPFSRVRSHGEPDEGTLIHVPEMLELVIRKQGFYAELYDYYMNKLTQHWVGFVNKLPPQHHDTIKLLGEFYVNNQTIC